VQMVTALIMQLIQSIIKLPDDGDVSAADPEVQKVRYNQLLLLLLIIKNVFRVTFNRKLLQGHCT